MSDERFMIDLHDFVKDEAKRTKPLLTSGDLLNMHGPQDLEAMTDRLRSYEEKSAILRSLLGAGTYWRPNDTKLWLDCFTSIASTDPVGGISILLNLRLYPALLMFYEIGLSSVLSDKYDAFATICYQKPISQFSKNESFGLCIDGYNIIGYNLANVALNLVEKTNANYKTPISDYIYDIVRPDFYDFVTIEEEYRRAFDKF